MNNKTVYALLTKKCNLSCNYCDVRINNDFFNRELFINILDKFGGNIVLFGGEPTLYPERLIDVYLSKPSIIRKVSSISSNLIKLNDKILSVFQLIGYISTSWNTNRFNMDQYHTWLNNLMIINSEIPDVNIRILITMTKDLLKLSANELSSIISEWESIGVIKDIRFEHYIGYDADEEYFAKCDDWLSSIYKKWNSKIYMQNIDCVNSWYFDCNNVYTLYPDGALKRGCPHSIDIVVPSKCYKCAKSDICKPCQLQRFCSYPRKFIRTVNNSLTKES